MYPGSRLFTTARNSVGSYCWTPPGSRGYNRCIIRIVVLPDLNDTMPIIVNCPSCSTKLSAPDSAAGKHVRCPKLGCGTIAEVPSFFLAEEVAVVEAAPVSKPRPKRVDDDEDDRPRKKSRRDEDDEDDRPAGKRKRRRDEDDDDDEYDLDQPRKRKRKKKGMGAGVIVAIVFGSLLALGGIGYGVYALVSGSKTSVPKGWVEYKSESDKFRAYFPEKPESQTIPAGFGGDPSAESVSLHALDPTKGERKIVVVIVVKFKSGTTETERDKSMKKFRENFSDKRDSIISAPRSVRWAGHRAEEITIEEKGSGSKKGGGVMRYFMTDTRAYIAIIGSETSGRMRRDEEDGFFDNFELLK